MRRSAVLAIGVFLLLLIGTSFLGCGGGSATSAVFSLNLTPATLSLNRGATAQLSVQALDSANNSIATPPVSFHSDNSAITVSSSGLLCAGQWDANFIVCQTVDNNKNLLPLGRANITATATGANNNTVISSTVVVTDHEPVDTVQVVPAPANPADCVSQIGRAQFSAVAFSNDLAACQRITGSPTPTLPCQVPSNTIGNVSWQVSPTQVATLDNGTHLAIDPATLTAAAPGGATVTAAIGVVGISAASGSAPFLTCPVASIHVHQSNTPTPPDTETSVTINKGASAVLTADVFDIKGVALSDTSSLTWLTSQPSLAGVSVGTAVAAAPGTVEITAACTPPSCNDNLTPPQPIYSDDVVTGTIPGTSASTVLVTTLATPPSGASNSIVPIDTVNNTTTTATTLPANMQVNSMVLTPSGNPVFLGTNQGLLRQDTTTTTAATPASAITGKVLAASDSTVVVSDTSLSQVFITSAMSTIQARLPIVGATAAAIAPDNSKIYIAAGNKLYVFASGLPLTSHPLTAATNSAQGVAFLSTGALAYVADSGAGADEVVSTCSDAINTPSNAANVGGSPTHIAAVPNASPDQPGVPVPVVVDANSPNIDEVDAAENAAGSAGGCAFMGSTPVDPSVTNSATSHDFGAGSFTARQLIVTLDSNLAIILSDKGVLVYCLSSSACSTSLPSKHTTVLQLSGGALPLSGGVTPDSAQLYVGANDGKVHRLDLKALSDAATITVSSLCASGTTNCNPDLVVVKPVQTVASVSKITVSPATATIKVGVMQNFTASGTFSDGTTRDVTNFVTWTSGTPTVATINATTGVATGVAAGTSTITATLTGVSGTATLTVQ